MAVRYETDGPVAVVTLDRPDVANAIDRPTADELVAAFRRFEGAQELHQRAWRDIRQLKARPRRGARIDVHGGFAAICASRVTLATRWPTGGYGLRV